MKYTIESKAHQEWYIAQLTIHSRQIEQLKAETAEVQKSLTHQLLAILEDMGHELPDRFELKADPENMIIEVVPDEEEL